MQEDQTSETRIHDMMRRKKWSTPHGKSGMNNNNGKEATSHQRKTNGRKRAPTDLQWEDYHYRAK